jgi:rhodanese-related sulfurtransferase
MNAAAPTPDRLQPRPAQGYAGDVTPELAYRWWQEGEAVLVDIRTDAERDWVGFVPGAVNLEWKHWPGMQVRAEFDAELRAKVPPGKKLVMLCRSGIRSIASSRRATELGYEAYNILEGFQGDPDASGHRDTVGGWRVRGLPWRQG